MDDNTHFFFMVLVLLLPGWAAGVYMLPPLSFVLYILFLQPQVSCLSEFHLSTFCLPAVLTSAWLHYVITYTFTPPYSHVPSSSNMLFFLFFFSSFSRDTTVASNIDRTQNTYAVLRICHLCSIHSSSWIKRRGVFLDLVCLDFMIEGRARTKHHKYILFTPLAV